MLSVTDLLNPVLPGPPWPRYGPSAAPPPSPSAAYSSDASSMMDRQFLAKRKMAKEPSGPVKSRAKGDVNFRPFEDLDEASLREVRRYQIHPFGGIYENCKHIPYNSGKKDFYEKTGRESFEGEAPRHLPPCRTPARKGRRPTLTADVECFNTPSRCPGTTPSTASCGTTTWGSSG